MSLLKVEGVTLRYANGRDSLTAVEQVDFQVRKSDRYVLLGPSGCGKSTILKAVGGYIKPAAGSILLNGSPIKAPGPDRIFVFQELDQLLPWKTVKQNIVFALTASGKLGRVEAVDRADHFLRKVNLADSAHS